MNISNLHVKIAESMDKCKIYFERLARIGIPFRAINIVHLSEET
jgi:hypothetical protein